nr:MAG TPA: hypothetical protein [Caudoviricetes sp.]
MAGLTDFEAPFEKHLSKKKLIKYTNNPIFDCIVWYLSKIFYTAGW